VSNRRKWDAEFREGAVRRVGGGQADRARGPRPGVNEGTLGNWVGKARESMGGQDAPLS
jgi:transposase-like protein